MNISPDRLRSAINDPSLSLRAKGLLAYVASRGDDFHPTIDRISAGSKDGKEAVASCLRELRERGLLPPAELAGRCPVCGGVDNRVGSAVTYIALRQRWIKVGRTSQRVELRLRSLRGKAPGVIHPKGMDIESPLTLIRSFGEDIEHELHRALADEHATGEWFLWTPNARRILASLDPDRRDIEACYL